MSADAAAQRDSDAFNATKSGLSQLTLVSIVTTGKRLIRLPLELSLDTTKTMTRNQKATLRLPAIPTFMALSMREINNVPGVRNKAVADYPCKGQLAHGQFHSRKRSFSTPLKRCTSERIDAPPWTRRSSKGIWRAG